MMFCQLGNIQFVRPQYVLGMEDVKTFGYAEHAHAQGKPTLEAVGDSLDTRTLDMAFDWSWCDPEAVYEKLVSEAAKKQAMALTFGSGTNEGKFVVTDMSRTYRKTGPDGTVQFIVARVSLKEYVDEEPLVTAKRQAVAQAPARKVAGKPAKVATKKGQPEFAVVKTTNKDGYTVDKIVRKA